MDDQPSSPSPHPLAAENCLLSSLADHNTINLLNKKTTTYVSLVPSYSWVFTLTDLDISPFETLQVLCSLSFLESR